jgi:hypothetical protein
MKDEIYSTFTVPTLMLVFYSSGVKAKPPKNHKPQPQLWFLWLFVLGNPHQFSKYSTDIENQFRKHFISTSNGFD